MGVGFREVRNFPDSAALPQQRALCGPPGDILGVDVEGAKNRDERKARAILLALVECLNRAGKKPGRTTLYKGFYLAHLLHAQHHSAVLSDWPIVKLDHGPGVDDGKRILETLAHEGVLTERRVPKKLRTGYEYELVRGAPADAYLGALTADEVRTIHDACDSVKDKDEDELDTWAHQVSPAWNAARGIGDELPIYADLLDDEDSVELGERIRDAEFHLKDILRKP